MLTANRRRIGRMDNVFRPGYTLFEVMLSLALILVLMTLIGTALNTHLHNQFHNRMQVEEAQLARALLNRIADDIRAVLLDPEEGENAASGSPSEDDTDETADNPADTSSADESDSESDTTSYDEDYAYEYSIVGKKKGIYGGPDWIQIDTCRTIPGERFAYEANNINSYSYDYENEEFIPELNLLSSGQKTVLYYLGYDSGTVDAEEEYLTKQKGTSVEPDRYQQGWLTSNIKYGLYYREMNRVIAEYAVEMGLDAVNQMMDNDEHLAPEVDNLEFYYYVNDDPDHAVEEGEWLDAWDMDAEGGQLPLAIEIRLSIRRKSYKPSLLGGFLSNENDRERAAIYSLVVPLSREMIDLSEVGETEETSE